MKKNTNHCVKKSISIPPVLLNDIEQYQEEIRQKTGRRNDSEFFCEAARAALEAAKQNSLELQTV